jgi:zinc protease
MEMARIVAATSVTRFRGTRARQDTMSSHRFAVVVFAVLLSTFTSAGSVLAQTTVTSERPASFTLDNGLLFVVIPYHRPRVVTLILW